MTTTPSERMEFERIAQEYRRRGYDVVIEPRDKDLPGFLAGTSPDLVAFSKEENVLIEVKSISALRNSRDLTEFAKRIENRAGWRFELITIYSSGEEKPAQVRWLSEDTIRALLKEAEDSAAAGHFTAALLVAYAATEAALFGWMTSESTPVDADVRESVRPRALVRQMAIEGRIAQYDSIEFQRIEELRNALAHGRALSEASESDVRTLVRIATCLLAKDSSL